MTKQIFTFAIIALMGMTVLASSDDKFAGSKIDGNIMVSTGGTAQLQIGSDHFFEFSDQESARVEGVEKGWFFSSKIKIQTKNGVFSFKVPKDAFITKSTFNFPSYDAQLFSVRSEIVSELNRTWQEEGTAKCDTGGDCGSYQCFAFDKNGICTSQAWISATCWGKQPALIEKKLFHDHFVLHLGDNVQFLSHPIDRVEEAVLKVWGQCN